MQTRDEMLGEFYGYVTDIFTQPETERPHKLKDTLGRLADSAVRIAASTLIPIEADVAAWSDEELAEAMKHHVVSRGGARLPNSAWTMMLEAAKRLSAGISNMRSDSRD